MNQRDAIVLACLGNSAPAEFLDGTEALAAAFEEDSHQIDHCVCALHGTRNGTPVAQVRLHGGDLADIAERLEMEGEIGTAHRGAHPVAALRQRPCHVAAEKPGSAKDRDDLGKVGGRRRAHGLAISASATGGTSAAGSFSCMARFLVGLRARKKGIIGRMRCALSPHAEAMSGIRRTWPG